MVRAYTQHLQFGREFPSDIEVSSSFLFSHHWVEKQVYPWELEVLAREIIINSPDIPHLQSRKSLKKWSDFTQILNKVKTLENGIGHYARRKIDIELYRIAHRQFPWQSKPHGTWLVRYYRIFKDPDLDRIIQRVIGLTAHELYAFGLALTGLYLDNFGLNYPANIEIPGIDPAKFSRFIEPFSSDVSILKKELLERQQFNENYLYTFNPMRARPLIKLNLSGKPSLVCPIPTFLFRRFTEGVFYEICNESDFGQPYGRSFQKYVGQVIEFAVGDRDINVQPEKEFYLKGERKDTVDWIVDEGKAAVFIECKTKRLRNEAKIDISSEQASSELDKMADYIVQVYKTIRDYRQNLYPNFVFDADKKVYPIIITLEEWFAFGNEIYDQINAAIKMKFEQLRLDVAWLEQMPYSICSVQDFERGIQVMLKVGIDEFLGRKMKDSEKKVLALHSYMIEDYPEQYNATKPAVPNTLDEIFPET